MFAYILLFESAFIVIILLLIFLLLRGLTACTGKIFFTSLKQPAHKEISNSVDGLISAPKFDFNRIASP